MAKEINKAVWGAIDNQNLDFSPCGCIVYGGGCVTGLHHSWVFMPLENSGYKVIEGKN